MACPHLGGLRTSGEVTGWLPDVLDRSWPQKRGGITGPALSPRSSRPEPGGRAGGRRECEWLGGLGVRLVVEGELVEVGCRAVAVEVDGRLDAARSMTNASRLSATSAGESIGRMNSHTAARSAPSPPGSASRSLRAMRSEPSALVRVTPAGSSTNAAPNRAVSWAMPRSGSGSSSARRSSASAIASSPDGSWRPVSPTGCWRSGSVQPAP